MSLFNFQEVVWQAKEINAPVTGKATLNISTAAGDKISKLSPLLNDLCEGHCIYFMTDGAWSNIDIVKKLIDICGPCSMDFCTWSISTDAIRKFTQWQQDGLITDLHVLLDQGLRNRKPEIFQQAILTFKNLKLLKCHAKVAVLQNEHFSFTIIGSANFTNNPRKEAGMIIRNRAIANDNIAWIRKEFENA